MVHWIPRTILRQSSRSRPRLSSASLKAGAARTIGIALAMIVLFAVTTAGSPPENIPPEELVGGLPRADALRLGERLYREGLLPSGEYVQATVQEELQVDGRAFNCMSCHQHSGLGNSDGNLVKLPITGPFLYKPFPKEQAILRSSRKDIPAVFRSRDVRPAYTHETLARAIRQGISAAGVQLHEAMPRFELSDRDMAILILYLDTLNRDFSPGVDEKTLRFATVITAEVSAEDRQAMLATLDAYVADRNSQNRHDEERSLKGSFEMEQMYQSYRRLSLDRWELNGPPDTWDAQLEAYYRKAPVFALLGGISTRDWRPVHAFCERNQLPCIYPLTDFPVLSDTDWYTLYFSRGLAQEGETAARYLAGREDRSPDGAIIQVYRDEPKGARLAGAFRDAGRRAGLPAPVERVLKTGESADVDFWRDLAREQPGGIIVAWLEAKDVADLAVLAGAPGKPRQVILSASLTGTDLAVVPETVRGFTSLTYPYSLPQEDKKIRFVAESWLRLRKIPVTNKIIQYKMYFLTWMLSCAVMDIRSWFYRDYFLESFDMSRDQTYNVGFYPRMSFGRGQRYGAKGCYIVQLGAGSRPELVKKSDWVVQ